MSLVYDVFETPFGWMSALASSRGLRRTTLPQPSPDQSVSLLGRDADAAAHDPARFGRLKSQLDLYFNGTRLEPGDEPIDVDDASPFVRAAWDACRSIPIGETRSYKWLAARAGSPGAARAAGQCMARNRLPIVVPCHRVIASDGALRGFGRGASQLELKQRLLDLEATARPVS